MHLVLLMRLVLLMLLLDVHLLPLLLRKSRWQSRAEQSVGSAHLVEEPVAHLQPLLGPLLALQLLGGFLLCAAAHLHTPMLQANQPPVSPPLPQPRGAEPLARRQALAILDKGMAGSSGCKKSPHSGCRVNCSH